MRDKRMKAIEDIVKDLGEDDRYSDSFQRLAILVAAMFVGADVDRLVSFTGYLREFVTDISGRMCSAGLWDKGVYHYEDMYRENEFHLAGQLAHEMVAEGKLIAWRRADGKFVYEVTEDVRRAHPIDAGIRS
jgi:hypothetical protein